MEFPELIVHWTDFNMWTAVVSIIFPPLFWNIVARWEHRTHTLSRIFRWPKVACCILGVAIILLTICRDWSFFLTLKTQPRWLLLQNNCALWSGHCLVIIGTLLVVSSFWKLGFYGTYLGDYFGILMPTKVTSFPFNLMKNPMYRGSTLNFLGTSLVHGSQTGLLLTLVVATVYAVAVRFEEPFTASIYMDAAKKKG